MSQQLRSPYQHRRSRATAPAVAPLRLATWNLECYGRNPQNDKDKRSRLAWAITNELNSPHILAVQEMCDDSGYLDNGTTSAETNAQRLIAQIKENNGPEYRYVEIPPQDNQDGGERGLNIRCGFFYRPDRVALADSPKLISPEHPCFQRSRKPLVAHFRDTKTDEDYLIANVHLVSNGGFGQTPSNAHWTLDQQRFEKRCEQVRQVAQFMDAAQQRITQRGTQQSAHLVVCGDFNTGTHIVRQGTSQDSSQNESVLQPLKDCGLRDAGEQLSARVPSHKNGSVSMTLDYVFLSPELHARMGVITRPGLNDGNEHTRLSDHNPTAVTIRAPMQQHEQSPQAATR